MLKNIMDAILRYNLRKLLGYVHALSSMQT
jgi:hypothetical protein